MLMNMICLPNCLLMMICNMMCVAIANSRLKENYMLVLETCHLENVEEDVEE